MYSYLALAVIFIGIGILVYFSIAGRRRESWFSLIFAPPGQGKSIEQARLSIETFAEYHRAEKLYPELPHRILMSNQKLNPAIALLEEQHGHYIYWEAPEALRYCPRKECWRSKNDGKTHLNHDVDIFIDEGATLFPADGWTDTPMWLRKMWAQHRHNGIRILMLTQDYMSIDINCRRMLWDAFYMHKVMGSRDISATLPPLARWTWANFLDPRKHVIWGMYTKQRFDPLIMKKNVMVIYDVEMDKDKEKQLQDLKMVGWKQRHLITWRKVNLYDTQQNVKEIEPKRELDHIEVKCDNPGCAYIHKSHRLK